mgnify:FL=1|nr:MAG TPA: hypothetical protein [Caudoviricetes sp.]
MARELKKYQDSIFYVNKLGGLVKIHLDSLEDYDHSLYNLHHYIEYQHYERNKNWYEDRGIKQKLILMSITLHEHVHNIGIKTLTDAEFEKKYKISRWKLIFNRKHSSY